jgi:hypothetical protein
MSEAPGVKSDRQLREATASRDRGLREKVMSLDEAASGERRGPRRHRRLHDVAHADRDDLVVGSAPTAETQVSRSIVSTEGDLLTPRARASTS